MKLLDKLFYQNAYAVGIRKIESDEDIVADNMGEYHMLMPSDNEWYADPFCYAEYGHVYLFMEIMGRNGKKGTLGVSEYNPGVGFSPVKEILREDFHLSYPNVFKYNSTYYMIPETNQSNQLRLYEATDFPYEWKLKKVLLEGCKLVDTSFLTVEGKKRILFSHDISGNSNRLRMFEIDLEAFVLEELPVSGILSKERPGGNAISIGGKVYRILQDCSVQYGEKIKVYCTCIQDQYRGDYTEEYAGEIRADMLITDRNANFTRIHTLTRSGEYEAVDTLYKRFYVTKPIRGIGRILARRLKGK